MRRIHSLLLVLVAAFSLTAASLPSTKPEDLGLSSRTVTADPCHGPAPHRRGRHYGSRGAGCSQRANRLSRSAGRHGPRIQEANDARFDVSHGLHDQACNRYFHHDDAGRGQASVGRSGIQIYSRIQGHEGRECFIEAGHGPGNPPKFYTIPAERPITIKDLLTHTSGLSQRSHGPKRSG